MYNSDDGFDGWNPRFRFRWHSIASTPPCLRSPSGRKTLLRSTVVANAANVAIKRYPVCRCQICDSTCSVGRTHTHTRTPMRECASAPSNISCLCSTKSDKLCKCSCRCASRVASRGATATMSLLCNIAVLQRFGFYYFCLPPPFRCLVCRHAHRRAARLACFV